jgi:hypothetical protein
LPQTTAERENKMKYRVTIYETIRHDLTVEAENEDDAYDTAYGLVGTDELLNSDYEYEMDSCGIAEDYEVNELENN